MEGNNMSAGEVATDAARDVAPQNGAAKRQRGNDGLPSRIEVRLDQPLPPAPRYNESRRGGKRHRSHDAGFTRGDNYADEEDTVAQVKQYIARLADREDPRARDDELVDMSAVLLHDLQQRHRGVVVDTIVECGMSMPLKQPYFAVLAGLLAKRDAHLVSDITTSIEGHMKKAFESGETRHIRLLLFFLSALAEARVFSVDDVVDMLVDLMQVGQACSAVGSPQADWAAHVTMSTMARSCPEIFNNELLWLSLRDYFEARSALDQPAANRLLTAMVAGEEHVFLCDRDLLQVLYDALLDMRSSEKFHVSVLRSPLQSVRDSLPRSALGSFMFRVSHVHGDSGASRGLGQCAARWAIPQRFHLMLGQNNPEHRLHAGLSVMDAIVLEQIILDQLYMWHEAARESMLMLADFITPFNGQQLLIETILSRVLDVNPSSLPGVYWRSLSVWCLRADPKMAVFLGRSVHRLFQKLDALSLAARERFATWFAFHLSNTNFEWPWSAWSEVANVTDPNEPRRYFVQSALHQGVRLCYYECVDDALKDAPSLRPLLPNAEAVPVMTCDDEGKREELCQKIHSRAPFDDLLEVAQNDVELIVNCILWHGQKSYSHFFSRFVLYETEIADRFKENPGSLIGVVGKFWAQSPQRIAVIVDKMMRHAVVPYEGVVDWLLGSYYRETAQDVQARSYVFCILHNAIDCAKLDGADVAGRCVIQALRGLARIAGKDPERAIVRERVALLIRHAGDVCTADADAILGIDFADPEAATVKHEIEHARRRMPADTASSRDDAMLDDA
ncbi:MIF4G domain-containing protein [Plasmodiophora brassicae]